MRRKVICQPQVSIQNSSRRKSHLEGLTRLIAFRAAQPCLRNPHLCLAHHQTDQCDRVPSIPRHHSLHSPQNPRSSHSRFLPANRQLTLPPTHNALNAPSAEIKISLPHHPRTSHTPEPCASAAQALFSPIACRRSLLRVFFGGGAGKGGTKGGRWVDGSSAVGCRYGGATDVVSWVVWASYVAEVCEPPCGNATCCVGDG